MLITPFLSMQAVARQAVGDFARGLSTGLVVWAGSRCPDCTCPAVTLTCSAIPSQNQIEYTGVPVIIVVLYVVVASGGGFVAAFLCGIFFGRASQGSGKGPLVRGRFAAISGL